MDQKLITSLQPIDGTSATITAAIARAATAKVAAEQRAKDAATELEAGAMTLTSSQRRNVRDVLEDAAADAKQIEAIAAALEAALVEAREREEGESLAAAQAALVARITDHEGIWLSSYRKHEAAVRALLAERQTVVDEVNAHNATAVNLRDFQIEVEELKRPIDATTFYADPEQREAARVGQVRLALERQAADERARWEALETRQRRFDELRAYAASRENEQIGAVVHTDSQDGKLVQRSA